MSLHPESGDSRIAAIRKLHQVEMRSRMMPDIPRKRGHTRGWGDLRRRVTERINRTLPLVIEGNEPVKVLTQPRPYSGAIHFYSERSPRMS